MNSTNTRTGELTFSIDSSLLFQLGERLVAKPSIALAELVKNAYDADATKVTVTMENVGEKGGTLLIEDNGHGMTFEELQSGWMRIATSAKRDNPVSRTYCRSLTGAKGIGRFAARRLTDKLMLESVAERYDGVKEVVAASFDWENDFLSGQDLTETPVSYTRTIVPSDTQTGVSLFLEGARDAWTEEDLVTLRRDLLSLQSPFPDLVIEPVVRKSDECLPDPGFDFQLCVEGSEDLEGLSGGLGQAFLEAAWAKLEGWIDGEGLAHYELDLYRIGGKDSLADKSNTYKGLEKARLRIYFMVYTSELFKDSDFGVREAQSKGRKEGGVRLYLDGFRVFPYGEPSDDWLQLDEYNARNRDLGTAINLPVQVTDLGASVPGRPFLLIPSNNQTFGVVALSQSEHTNVEINVTRDRLIETPAVAALRHFVQNGIYWMTLKYAAYVAQQKSSNDNKARTVPEIINGAKAVVESQTGIPEERRRLILWSLDNAVEQAEEEEKKRISEISMLRVLASAGTTLTLMNHQLQALTGSVLQIEQDLLRLKPEISQSLHGRFDDLVNQVSEWHEMVTSQVSQLGFLLSPDSRQRRRRHVLRQVVENVRRPMSYYMEKHGVIFENKVPQGLRTPAIYQSELYSVLINLLSNALKAIYGEPERRIAVEAELTSGVLHVRMLDSGVGLAAELREVSFRAFETTSLPNPELGVGTGLGLKVVSDTLDLYGGTARFVDTEAPWKTCVEILLPS